MQQPFGPALCAVTFKASMIFRNSGEGGENVSVKTLLKNMWQDYCELNPSAKNIHDLFVAEGESVINDHIALRTFQHPKLGLKVLARHFEVLGYKKMGEYRFEEKKLYAEHFEHISGNEPKIFISELELHRVSPFVHAECEKMIAQVPDLAPLSPDFLHSGRPWPMSHAIYTQLAAESEYASWLGAFGFRPNHFTVSVNHLQKLTELPVLNAFIKKQGFQLNTAGGEIKGGPLVYLEQSSTMARPVKTQFSDGVFEVPGCYYEFARRYPLPNGELYQGFVEKSADKIFESTNRQSSSH